jgi:long-chain fatty acid transport protein
MRGLKMLAVLLVLLLMAGTSFAAGFRLQEAGVKAMGMGFAFTAQADDPSAIYFNPAGLTQLEGNNLMIGVTSAWPSGGEFTGSTPLTLGATISETQKSLNFYIPNAYYTYTDKSRGMAFGVGVFTPFGLGQEYQNRDISIFRNQTTKIDLQTIVINPTIAFDIDEYISIGVGIDYMWGKVKYQKTPVVPAGAPFGGPGQFYTNLEGSADAWGYNFGILLKPTKNVKVGFNYRSPFKPDVKDGDFTASNLVGTANPLIFPMGTTRVSGTLNLPATAAFGVSYTFNRLTVEADADWTLWSSYNELKITNSTVSTYTTTQAKNWEDVCAIRIGAEYRVTDPLALRVGFVYDPTPVPAETLGPDLADSTRLNYMVGVGYKVGKWTIDVAGMYIEKKDRTVSNIRVEGGNPVGQNGTWTGDGWLAGLDVGYKF